MSIFHGAETGLIPEQDVPMRCQEYWRSTTSGGKILSTFAEIFGLCLPVTLTKNDAKGCLADDTSTLLMNAYALRERRKKFPNIQPFHQHRASYSKSSTSY